MRAPNELTAKFANELVAIRNIQEVEKKQNEAVEKLHISTTGAILTGFYESLRKAGENTEENLLLTRAIRRFFKRLFLTQTNAGLKNSGDELITELTLAGYLKNDTIPLKTIAEIDQIINHYAVAYHKLYAKFSGEVANRWTLETLAVSVESKLVDHRIVTSFIDFAYNYFLKNIDREALFSGNPPASYEAMLFVAVQKIILKYDNPTIRTNLISRYQVSPSHTVNFAKLNAQIDQILDDPALNKISHTIDRNAAPFRIFLKILGTDNLAKYLESEKALLSIFTPTINKTYLAIRKDVSRGIVRSAILLLIPKLFLVAYDIHADMTRGGAINWLPLMVQLCPVIYMFALRLTLFMPGANNSRALTRQITQILFDPIPKQPSIGRGRGRKFGVIYTVIYGMIIIAAFFGIGFVLWEFVGFYWLRILTFFIYISMASFLGFRLSRKIRDVEVGNETQNSLTALRDLIYMPFVVVGRSINKVYAQFNIVSTLLDMLVELPLKTILRLIRRWSSFLSDMKDSF
ncbi:hypothetical protein FWF74_02035 [Candidatus Saccharibacteria bacterium]|nr:hypothetical protein [Candidatus Saccharibacteria bacterium]MCL1963259.1 hypothetical protein [Candidatus Saccharibacteria bacterium]